MFKITDLIKVGHHLKLEIGHEDMFALGIIYIMSLTTQIPSIDWYHLPIYTLTL